jgi:uncharacterized protein (TIRG00374 family)
MQYTRAFLLSAAFGIVVLSILALYGDAPRLLETAAAYPLGLLAPVLLLTSVNYALRWAKWRYYLHLIGARHVSAADSVLIFLSGFAMGLTPAKVGEIVKPILLRERGGVPLAVSSPIPFAERLTDGVALVLLAGAGLLVYGRSAAPIGVILIGAAAALVVLRTARLRRLTLRVAHRIPLLGRRIDRVEAMLESAATLLGWRAFGFAVGLGVVSWGCEALAFFLVLGGLGVPATPALLLQATFALASATLLGSALLTPGGLGVAEATLTYFLVTEVGLAATPATFATLLIRLCTLWFGVLLGSLALLVVSIGRRGPLRAAPSPETA